jgi:hypothetical protein
MRVSWLLLLPALCGTCLGAEDWVTGEVQDDTNFAVYVHAYEQLIRDERSFSVASSTWYRGSARGFEVYSRSRDLTARIRSLVHVVGSAMVARFDLQLPRTFKCQIYVYRDKHELSTHLPEDLQLFGLARWHDKTAALGYQLEDDGTFNLALLYDDIPYLLSVMLLEQYAGSTPIPAALRYGIAFEQQTSFTNALRVFGEELAQEKQGAWMGYEELMKFEPDPRDDPALLRRFNLTSAALAAYLHQTTTDEQQASLLRMLAQGTPPEQAFGATLELGQYDVLGKLEEDVYGWVQENYQPAEVVTKAEKKKIGHRTTVSIAVMAVIVAVGVTLLSWIKQIIT